jgi:hypothetical protein
MISRVKNNKAGCFTRYIMRFFLVFTLLSAALLVPSARAQSTNYSISWYTIAGGGGTSSGGNYTVSGTIGQPATGTMSGGNYSLTGGFWSLIAVVQTPGAPPLNITRTGNQATVSWLAPASGFVLEQSQNLNTGSWSVSSTSLSTNNGVISATVPAGSGYQFYRLHNP